MTDNTHRKVPRGPLVSSRQVVTNEQLDKTDSCVTPAQVFAEAAYEVAHDLIKRVGYQNKVTVTIEPLKKEHPESPGYMIAAKMRRP